MRAALALILGLWAGVAAADAPQSSLRPEARPFVSPVSRTGAQSRAEWYMPPLSAAAPVFTGRPSDRPAGITDQARAEQAALQRGSVCGDVALQGEALGNYDGSGSCGVEDAVRLRSVLGLRLSQPAIIDCRTARALKTWVERGVRPAVGTEGGGAVGLRVMASYACRSRNNQPGARLSEHSFGRAIDIGGVQLRNGAEISVLRGWGTSGDGAQLRQMWRAACGPFGTVLGPDSDRFHRDHFHFDTARYRSGSYCR